MNKTISKQISLSILEINTTDLVTIKGPDHYAENKGFIITGGYPQEYFDVRLISYARDDGGYSRHAASQGWIGKEGEIITRSKFDENKIAKLILNCGGCDTGHSNTVKFALEYRGYVFNVTQTFKEAE